MVYKKSQAISDSEINALIPLLQNTRKGRQLLSRVSYKWFAKYYFGFDLYPHQIRWLKHLTDKANAGVLAPLGHGKTFAVARIFVLHNIVFNRDIRILLLSATDEKARENLSVISDELRHNDKLIEDFGTFYVPPAGDTRVRNWTQTKIRVKRNLISPDPTVRSAGIRTNVTGGRYDLILLDDVINDDNAASEAQRKYVKSHYDITIEQRLEAGGWVLFIGTRYDFADLYGEFLKAPMIWDILIEKAIIREPKDFEFVELKEPERDEHNNWIRSKVIIRGDRGECLDPVNRPMEYLLKKKYLSNMGSRNFNLVYQNEVSSEEEALFKLQWLQPCRDEELSYVDYRVEINEKGNVIESGTGQPPPARFTFNTEDKKGRPIATGSASAKYIYLVESTDPSVATDKRSAEKNDDSYMVSMLTGLRENGDIDLLHIYRDRGITPAQKLKVMVALSNRFVPYRHFYECNTAGNMDISYIKENSSVRIARHYTGKNKNDAYSGIPGLSIMFEERRIRLPYKTPYDKKITDDLINEFHRFPNGEHDDQVLALWINYFGSVRVIGEYEILKNRNRTAA